MSTTPVDEGRPGIRRRVVRSIVLLAVLVVGVRAAKPYLRGSVPPEGTPDCAGGSSHACMVLVPGGTFLMGAQSADPAAPNFDPLAEPHETPVHEVVLPPFWMHQAEVSAMDFLHCIEVGDCPADSAMRGSGFSLGRGENERWPINGVTWAGADAFCRHIGGRLPTEAEWEFVARGGRQQRWIQSNDRPRCPRAVVDGGCSTGHPLPASLGPWMPPYNIGCLAGNVWEWTADWYGPYGAERQESPRGPSSGSARVQRGGSYATREDAEMRSAHRAALEPELQLDDVGFRCAADAAAPWKRALEGWRRKKSP
jgi:formylglycine-generating enzyme required for sulfatase activity